jgi:hypothetical protein
MGRFKPRRRIDQQVLIKRADDALAELVPFLRPQHELFLLIEKVRQGLTKWQGDIRAHELRIDANFMEFRKNRDSSEVE